MASLSQLTFNIANIFRGGYTSSQEPVSNRQIAFWIGYYRAQIIKRELDNRKTLSRKFIQDLGCLALEEVDKADCCEYEWGCSILRTVEAIPNMIQSSFIGLIDKQSQIPFTTSTQANWSQNNRYTANMRKAYWQGNRIYLINGSRLRAINVRGVFSDPLAAAELVDCDGKVCFSWDSEYPLPEEFIQPITDMIVSKEGRFIFSTPNDQTTDGTKEIAQG